MSKGLAIIYDRASTKKQEENYTRLDVAKIGKDLAKRYDYTTEAEPRFEQKSGEELRNRPVMLGILNEIQSGKLIEGQKIAAIVVSGFTRLSRDEDNIDGLIIRKTCRDFKVVVIDFNGKIYNFANDNDQDTAFLEFWFASREKRQIVSNMLRGQKEKASQGKFMGGFPPLGYQNELSGEVNRRGTALQKRVVDPEEARLVEGIFIAYTKMSAMEVAAALNSKGKQLPIKNLKGVTKNVGAKTRPFTTPDIMRIINNPLYAGWVQWNSNRHWGKRPQSKHLRDFEPQIHFDPSLQIISQELFDRAQRIRKERYSVPSRAVFSRHPFSYILKCHGCGGPLWGTMYHTSSQPLYRRHLYRCNTHYDNPQVCPKGQTIVSYAVASALIPFVAHLIKDRTKLVAALEEAAINQENTKTMQQLEVETRAELQKVNRAVARLMDSISEGLITREEAGEKVREVREKKERLTKELQRFEERATIRAELLEAIKHITDDLERVLWGMFEHQPRVLAQIVRLIFRRRSVVVEAYWDKETPGPTSNPEKRKGRIVQYELQEAFQELGERVVGQSPVARAAPAN